MSEDQKIVLEQNEFTTLFTPDFVEACQQRGQALRDEAANTDTGNTDALQPEKSDLPDWLAKLVTVEDETVYTDVPPTLAKHMSGDYLAGRHERIQAGQGVEVFPELPTEQIDMFEQMVALASLLSGSPEVLRLMRRTAGRGNQVISAIKQCTSDPKHLWRHCSNADLSQLQAQLDQAQAICNQSIPELLPNFIRMAPAEFADWFSRLSPREKALFVGGVALVLLSIGLMIAHVTKSPPALDSNPYYLFHGDQPLPTTTGAPFYDPTRPPTP